MAVWMNPFTGFFSHMGGEGASWIGQAPFTDEKHIFVNLGDGTYSHSGSLAIRAAVAANVNATYKILYNSAVAMTGGQAPDMSAVTVPDIAAQVLAEGVKRCVVVTEDLSRYSRVPLPQGVTVHDRRELDKIQDELKETPGVTVLIYDQMCATERRRKRKRGKLPVGEKRVWIHPEVCEGCGDCSKVSNCLSVEPLETELGRKRQINQSTCNQDYSCVEGFCPSFVTLYGAEPVHPQPTTLDFDAATLPTPPPASIGEGEAWSIVFSGVGGTGVTTVAAILGMAAHIDGRASSTLDMTGLAQKGGAVFSHVRIAKAPEHIYSARVPPSTADVIIAADMVVADSPEAEALMQTGRTKAVYNLDVAPTSQFVTDRDAAFDPQAHRAELLRGAEDAGGLEAERLAVDVLGDAIYTNMIITGFAWQKGLIPVSSRAMERAIKLNRVKIDENRAAFDLGRLAAYDPERVAAMLEPHRPELKEMSLDELIAHREKLLTNYQNADYAARYRALIDEVRAAEARLGSDERLTRAAAFNLAKLMAYKDEYEVARLFTSTDWESHVKQHFEGTKRIAFNLAPPILSPKNSRTGAPSKLEFGGWMKLGFKLLAKMKGLRGTAWDVFGRSEERRAERKLIEDYEATLKRLIAELTSDNLDLAVEIASVPEEIRGYGHVKAAAMEKAAEAEAKLWAQWERKAAA
jgi:indolepyruvate ferredoxin oxidoreductase